MTETEHSDWNTTDHINRGRLIDDYEAMIKADREHLAKALARGDRVIAHGYVDSIIDNRRLIEDTI
jgi:hypothetical protein